MQLKPINVVMGLPDDGCVRVNRIEGSNLNYTYRGTANFLDHLSHERNWRFVWVGRAAPLTSHMVAGPVVNYIAEADWCGVALSAAKDIAANLGQPWFNHPDCVLQTTRDAVSQILRGIQGLDVPRTIRLLPRTPKDIKEAISVHGLGYPVLVRPTGEHGSHSLIRLDHADDEEALFMLPWGGRELYITQFRDFSNDEGLYRKFRIAVIGGQPFIRHAIVNTTWNVNPRSRSKDPRLIEAESSEMRDFKTKFRPKIMPIVTKIYERLRLDYFGIDCALKDDGSMTLFEANATMTMLRRRPLPNAWDEATLEIQAALLSVIDDPRRWVAA